MSTIQNSQNAWTNITDQPLDSKHEKCRNIAEEIYKRINITFQIKKLEASQSDISDHNSDQIDSNELSNETDLFACDKSDSISSSTEAEKPQATCEKYININNNEETNLKKTTVVYKRPKKRFRKRVKKRSQAQRNRNDSDGSSDEALPLSRIVEIDTKCTVQVKSEPCTAESPDNIMGVPNIVIVARDLKPKPRTPEKKWTKKDTIDIKQKSMLNTKIQDKMPSVVLEKNIEMDRAAMLDLSMKSDDKGNFEWKYCTLCSLSFRGDRGLRRHMTMSHIINLGDTK